MGLYSIKPWFVRRLRRLEDALVARRVRPDTLTALAVAASAAAGAAIALGGWLSLPILWLAVPPLVLVRLALNALDGSIARRTGRARPFGAALNEMGDRLSDAATIGATAAVVDPALAFGAVAGSFLASNAGVTAHAVTGQRDCGGPVGKADRAMLLAAGALGAMLFGPTAFTIVVAVILAGSLVTAAARLVRMRRTLASRRGDVRVLLAPATVDAGSFDTIVEEEMLHAFGR